jgi:MFS family permease
MAVISADRPATRLATRLAFLLAGFATACWAPLVPFAKQRLRLNDGELGLLLLCAAVGALAGATFSGPLTARHGSRRVILAGGLGLCGFLPVLAIASTPAGLGAALFCFGASLGGIDVAMNAHAVEVESAAARPLMSGFHALYSLGGFAGAGLVTLLLSQGAAPLTATLCGAGLGLGLLAIATPRLLATRSTEARAFAWPVGVVLVIAALAALSFLAEGAVLDWGALLVVERKLESAADAGFGFGLFSIAMTAGRLSGDVVVARLGRRQVLVGGGLLAIAGFATLLLSPWALAAMAGFLLVGLGLANIVPILFSAAGRQSVMAPSLAIAAITTTGYVGILAGPPLVGFVARAAGLPAAFWLLTALLCLVPLLARPAAQ